MKTKKTKGKKKESKYESIDTKKIGEKKMRLDNGAKDDRWDNGTKEDRTRETRKNQMTEGSLRGW